MARETGGEKKLSFIARADHFEVAQNYVCINSPHTTTRIYICIYCGSAAQLVGFVESTTPQGRPRAKVEKIPFFLPVHLLHHKVRTYKKK